MAFEGFDTLFSKTGNITKNIDSFNDSFLGLLGNMGMGSKVFNNLGKIVKGVGGSTTTKNLAKVQKGVGSIISGFGTVASVGLDIFGVFLQFADSLGILKPLLDIVNTVFQVIGASAMEAFMPALMDLYDVLFSPTSMAMWGKLGATIGDFLSFVITGIMQLFQQPGFLLMINMFVKALMFVFKMIAGTLGAFLSWVATWNPLAIAGLFIVLAAGIAFLFGLMIGGPIGPALGIAFAVATVALLSAAFASVMFFAEGGIVTKPTLAIIGESGPEAVVPLNGNTNIGGNNEEMLWATQDNGEKLDRIYYTLSSRGRLL